MIPSKDQKLIHQKIKENIHDLTPEIYRALSSTSNTGKTMKNKDDNLTKYNIAKDLGYTVVGDKKSTRKTFCTITLPNLVDDFQNKTFDENTDDSDDLQGEGLKIIKPTNKIDMYTRLEISLGLKFFGHTDTLTETSNIFDDLYKRGENQNKQKYRIVPNTFHTN